MLLLLLLLLILLFLHCFRFLKHFNFLNSIQRVTPVQEVQLPLFEQSEQLQLAVLERVKKKKRYSIQVEVVEAIVVLKKMLQVPPIEELTKTQECEMYLDFIRVVC